MPDHVHLMVVPGEGVTVSDVMRRFKSYASHELQRRGKYKGRVWHRRFYDRAIRTHAALLETLGYIHENPVAAGLAPQVGDYPFSSCHFYDRGNSRVAIDAFDD
jgi:putative transposase